MDTLNFFKQSIIDFRNTGSFLPSSSRLAKRMASPISARPDLVIVELGAGTGSFTKYLLDTLPEDARLISIEINPILADRLTSSIHDERITIINGDARYLSDYLSDLNIHGVDYIISGIPLGNLSRHDRYNIYEEIYANLKQGGAYVQFQYLLANFIEIKRQFSIIDIAWEARNIPPAFIYTCELRR